MCDRKDDQHNKMNRSKRKQKVKTGWITINLQWASLRAGDRYFLRIFIDNIALGIALGMSFGVVLGQMK